MEQPPPIHYPESVAGMLEHLQRRLPQHGAEERLRRQAELAVEINRLKRERRAVILGHNYMAPCLFHTVPDFTGDSLELSRIAAQSQSEVIVFCGVRFMAETAKILNPARQVLLPSVKGGCSLAESISGAEIRLLRALYPGVPVVSYVNTSAEAKAESDSCCTSGNAAQIVRHLRAQGHERVLFVPDEYLARNIGRESGMEVVVHSRGPHGPAPVAAWPPRGPQLIAWRGRCEVHERFTVADIEAARQAEPGVRILAHPECSPEVTAAADFTGSTSAMIRYVEQLQSGRYLLLTECAMGDNIAYRNPRATLVRRCQVRCPHMDEITLEETLAALQELRFTIEVPEQIRERARLALEQMIAIS